jgi:hypothetical protein
VEEVRGGLAAPFFRKIVVFASKIQVFCLFIFGKTVGPLPKILKIKNYTSVIIKSSPNGDVFGAPVIISLFEISFTIILCINTKLGTNLGLIGLTKQRKK